MSDVYNNITVPFLKWAGGKRWLVYKYPHLFNIDFKRYVEPFLGSGAVFFHLRPARAILSDINADLINVYNEIRDNYEAVERELLVHANRHNSKYYYNLRKRRCRLTRTRAAQFIYLNRTCWNGLYRVNMKGEFNVPKGTKSKVVLDTDDFKETSLLLKRASIKVSGYEDTIKAASSGDLLFVDPPYTVKHNYNGFVRYNENLFSWGDQLKLNELLIDAKQRGVKIISTNAYHGSIIELYSSDFELLEISRHSVISASSRHRRECEELLILG